MYHQECIIESTLSFTCFYPMYICTHVCNYYYCASVAVSNDTVSLPSTTSPSQPTDSIHQTCDTDVVPSAVPVSSSSDHSLVIEVTDPHTTEPATDDVSPINNAITATAETDTTIPGMYVCTVCRNAVC